MQAINRVLRAQAPPQRGSTKMTIPVVLPDWCEKGTSLVYISKSNGAAHTVKVEKIEERQQMVVIRFESDRKIWKRVPFMEVKRFGDGTLRPLWKKTEVATVPSRPANFVDNDDDEEPAADAGPVESMTAPSPELVQDEEEAAGMKRPADKGSLSDADKRNKKRKNEG
eukprot:TRINITY_DN3709_c0_g1_i2.p1 TRINITY_DN3709_c0_g1~~TRINITY_DN3709_c0_g1_i2.p1  ORF type:complete len:168 (-),score=45.39 TRINITY_DN3709_c0_g1_i2:98-601(-)